MWSSGPIGLNELVGQNENKTIQFVLLWHVRVVHPSSRWWCKSAKRRSAKGRFPDCERRRFRSSWRRTPTTSRSRSARHRLLTFSNSNCFFFTCLEKRVNKNTVMNTNIGRTLLIFSVDFQLLGSFLNFWYFQTQTVFVSP